MERCIGHIGEVLQKISPEIVETYEKLNLPSGQKLDQLWREYQAVDREAPERFDIALGVWTWSLILGGVGALALFGKGYGSANQIFIPSVGIFSLLTLWLFIAGFRAGRAKKILARCETVLYNFGNLAQGLHHPMGVEVEFLDHESVRNHFVLHAKRILEAKEKFRRVRFDEKKLESEVCEANYQIRDYESKFQWATWAVAKFGLKFKNSELFAAAERQLQKA